ncbi:MAG: restriction endonuclease subunit S [Candidatus Berkiella sp.]
MSFDVIENTLDSICLLVVDCPHSTPVWTESGVVVLRNQNIKNGRLDLTTPSYTDEEHYKSRTKRAILTEGDIVITREAPMGEVCQIPKGLRCCLGQRQVLLRANPEKIDSRFLLFALQSPYLQRQIGWNEGTGSTVSNLRIPVLEALKVPTPPLQVQKEIASILSALDDRIFFLRETNTTLEAIAKTLFKSWFVDFDPVKAKAEDRLPEGMDEAIAALFPSEFEESALGLIPKGWRVEKLGDIVQRITKGTTPTTLKKPFVSSGINFIKAESMTQDGDFIPDKFAFIDSDTHELLRRSQLQSGDVLITIAGTIGRMAIITEEFLPANTNQAVAIIRPISEHLPSGLLSLFLQTSALREVMDGKIVQAVQANLSLTSLSDLQLVIPPKQTVSMLYQVGIAHINDVKKHNRSMIRTLTTLRDTLLPRLISGQLRLNQAQDLVDEVAA